MKSRRRRTTRASRGGGFTLVELLVVVSIIALLISILLPSLKGARDQAKATQCGTNLHHVGQAMAMYTADSSGYYPPSYAYPKDQSGSVDLRNQDIAKPYGYVHWSWYLYSNGKVNDEAFRCPSLNKGGAPRTNPGPNTGNWEIGEQSDQDGQTQPHTGSLEDKQASRMGYTCNAAIVPRNKTTRFLSGGMRVNRQVSETLIKRPGGTILATEFIDNWKAITKPGGGTAPESRSHRPVNPFFHVGSTFDEYKTLDPGFIYGLPADQKTYGLVPYRQALRLEHTLDHESGVVQVNAVGRHHPGGARDAMGGTANFLFVDTHVERKTVLETMHERLWGDRYYSVDGRNEVMNMRHVHTNR